MKYEIVKLRLSGSGASIYTVLLVEEGITLFDRFLIENNTNYKNEIDDILQRIKIIGKKGAREQWFKTKEGKPGDHVCALYDWPGSKLRLYCIRHGTLLVILGGGGPKEKHFKALQEDEKLTEENRIIKQISDDIWARMKEDEIWFSEDFMDLEGNLEF